MTPQQIRLELLKLCMPATANPDVQIALDKARTLEAYVNGAGHASGPPRETVTAASTQARTNQPFAGPARK